MDKAIEKKSWPARRIIIVVGAGLLVVVVAALMYNQSGRSRLKVDPARMTTATVEYGEFLEYSPADGTVEPVTSVYLDIEEGGRVDEIFVEGGQRIEKGDLILRFSNATLQRTAIDTETQLLENLDTLRSTKFNRAQSSLLLRDSLLDLEFKILELEKRYKRYQALMKKPNVSDLSVEAFETTRDELAYLKNKRTLMQQRIQQEDILSQQQLDQANTSIEKLTLSLGLLTRIVDSLDVRAPISGYLSSIDAEIGQSIARGQRIGQIDVLDKFKLRVRIDQFYIAKVNVGTPGHFDLDGRTYAVAVQKIYPEVVESAFEVDVAFVDPAPQGIKRGQTVTVELSFGEPSQSLMVAKGSFSQQTSGRWVYLIAEDGQSARRTNIRLGRQNPRFVEVVEGLQEGDRIITSGYDNFNGVDELQFTKPLKLSTKEKT